MSSSATEAQRLRVLLDLNILDSAPEERFDRLTRIAARIFQVPMAFVSLVDADRLWFKSQVGFPDTEAPSAQSFCVHAIRQDDMLVVCDAHAQDRFAANPYVHGFPHVRFYAGQPLSVNGVHIGTLCLADSVPREFSDEDRVLLRDLAKMVANEAAAQSLEAAQQRVRRSEASLRALLEHLPDSMLLLDQAGAVVSCNPAAEQLFGATAAQLTGRAAAALLGLDPAALAAQPARIEGELARTDGVLRVEAALSALEIDGRPHIVASVRDVSAHHAALERERAAEQSRRAYFRNATHELRTPLASILGFSELLAKRDFDQATHRELLGIIHTQSTRLLALINQMLDLARIDAGGPDEQQRVVTSLAAPLAGAIASAVPSARRDDLALVEAPGLPPVSANVARLQQALENILSNAVQFSPPGSRIDVALAPAMHGGRPGASVVVRDHGVGMTPEHSARMFDAFYRAGEQPDVVGSGLGMTLAQEIIAFHGGAIEVASRPGAGTSVTLWLPPAQEAP